MASTRNYRVEAKKQIYTARQPRRGNNDIMRSAVLDFRFKEKNIIVPTTPGPGRTKRVYNFVAIVIPISNDPCHTVGNVELPR